MVLDCKQVVLVVSLMEVVLVDRGINQRIIREHRYAHELPPCEIRFPNMPRCIPFQPYEMVYTRADANLSFPGYYLPDTGSTANHTALSLSTVNPFGVKAPPGTEIIFKLINEKDNNTTLEFHLGNRSSSLKVEGMNRKGVWVAQSSVELSNDTFKWFTLERSRNYIAIYESRNQKFPLLDFDNVGNDDIDFHSFERYSVGSRHHSALWDFLGYSFDAPKDVETPDKSVWLNPFVKSALLDVQEQYLRYIREYWRCDFLNKNFANALMYTTYKERAMVHYLAANCEPDILGWSVKMAEMWMPILLIHGFPVPSRAKCDNSKMVFFSSVDIDMSGFYFYVGLTDKD